ncbi:hypothetical protein DFH11DRAFT_1639609, partial [Phellopilus nigrolimitatus]
MSAPEKWMSMQAHNWTYLPPLIQARAQIRPAVRGRGAVSRTSSRRCEISRTSSRRLMIPTYVKAYFQCTVTQVNHLSPVYLFLRFSQSLSAHSLLVELCPPKLLARPSSLLSTSSSVGSKSGAKSTLRMRRRLSPTRRHAVKAVSLRVSRQFSRSCRPGQAHGLAI